MEVELMAIAEALSKLRLFISRCNKLNLYTDNKCALGHINSNRLPTSGRALKFLVQIQNTKGLKARYIATKENSTADAISRGILETMNVNHLSYFHIPNSASIIVRDRIDESNLIEFFHNFMHNHFNESINVTTRAMKKSMKTELQKLSMTTQTELDIELLESLVKETFFGSDSGFLFFIRIIKHKVINLMNF